MRDGCHSGPPFRFVPGEHFLATDAIMPEQHKRYFCGRIASYRYGVNIAKRSVFAAQYDVPRGGYPISFFLLIVSKD